MAKKQSDYLASLLSDADDPRPVETKSAKDTPPAPADAASANSATARAGLSLLGRESALARVASGEVKQVTQLLLDPARVKIWAGNARNQMRLTEETCRDLIDSIRAEGGQKVPAVVRHLKGDPDYDYELIAGTRRHFAISWLRANSYPDMKLLVQVADLDDEAAFRLADIENRARKDISDIERARNYADAVERHYGGRSARMAERLNLSKGWLSKMLKAATLPDAVVAAFANPQDLSLNPAYKLAVAYGESAARASAMTAEAERIAAQNAATSSMDGEVAPSAEVIKRLLGASTEGDAKAKPPAPKAVEPFEITNANGRLVCAVKSVTRQGVTVHLPVATGMSRHEILLYLDHLLIALEDKGVTLR
jgi:ParB family chromosome partitioning protein